LEIEGTNSASAATSNIHFGSPSQTTTSGDVSQTEDQLNYIYREVVKLRKTLESIEEHFRLRTDKDDNLVMSKTKAAKIADLFKDAADALNHLFDKKKIKSSPNSDLEAFVSEIRSNLESAVSEGFDSTSSTLQTDYGISFDFGVSARRIVDFTPLDQNELIRRLTTDGGPVDELFYSNKNRDNDGLLEKMLKALKTSESDLKDILGTSGIFVNTKA
jgi:regulator of replication initiation timing